MQIRPSTIIIITQPQIQIITHDIGNMSLKPRMLTYFSQSDPIFWVFPQTTENQTFKLSSCKYVISFLYLMKPDLFVTYFSFKLSLTFWYKW